MEEQDATLDDVLAFLDAFEPPADACEASGSPLDDAASGSSDRGASNASESDDVCASAVDKANGVKPTLNARLSRRAAGYTTQLQRRKRAEIAGLREESRDLEARLALLRRMARLSGAEEAHSEEEVSTLKGWARLEEQAANELRARRRAEVANKQLRARLESHAKLREEISRVIDKHRRREGRSKSKIKELVFDAGPEAWRDSLLDEVNESLSHEMRDKLQAMYEQVDTVFAEQPGSPCSLETSPLPDGAEIRTCTTVACCVDEAESLLWRKPVRKTNGGVRVVADTVGPDKDSYIKRFLLSTPYQTSQQQSGSKLTREAVLHVEHFGQRFREVATGSVIIVMLALIRMPPVSDGVLLREFWWTRIDPVKNTNRVVSMAQTCYRIGAGDPIPNDQTGVRVDVMRALVLRTRQNHATIQNWLLEAADAW